MLPSDITFVSWENNQNTSFNFVMLKTIFGFAVKREVKTHFCIPLMKCFHLWKQLIFNLFIGELLLTNECINCRSFFNHDTSITDIETQQNYNNCLGLPMRQFKTVGKGGLKAEKEGLKLITTKAEQFNPNIVIIELGNQ